MKQNQDIFRTIPQVEVILQDREISGLVSEIGRPLALAVIRRTIEDFKDDVRRGTRPDSQQLLSQIIENLTVKKHEKLGRVINCTGVFIHTNLGRSPLGNRILESLKKNISGYCNLEIDLDGGVRGKRGSFAEELASAFTGAEDSLIVNNNAAAVFLILAALAKGREVIVSRGELVQIGGGFRIPDIMSETGAVLVEVGTTNVTTADDYAKAINSSSSMIFSAHTSNFKIKGFTETPSIRELAALKSESLIFVRDIGSGNFHGTFSGTCADEPAVNIELEHGADIVCFSADKLMGSCQAGIIAGRKDIISLLRKHPLMRMLRPDKVTYFLLQETLLSYASGAAKEIPLWMNVSGGKKLSEKKIASLMEKLGSASGCLEVTDTVSTFGGGSMPLHSMESMGVTVEISGTAPEKIYRSFLRLDTPVVGTVRDGKFVLDFAAVFDEELDDIARAIKSVAGSD